MLKYKHSIMDPMMSTPEDNSYRSLKIMLFVVLVVGFIAYIVISAVKPSALPNELRLYSDTTTASENIPSSIEKIVEPSQEELKTPDPPPANDDGMSNDVINFENPPGNPDTEIKALSIRPEMDAKSDRTDQIPQRLMGAVNGAIKLYREQTAAKNNPSELDAGFRGSQISNYNTIQTALS